jgi:hypothetical protein
MAHFLFDRRQGHCEYFASAMAVMLRVVHIPSRVATGFQSGQYNPMTGWHVVRASDAHSWVEAWIPNRGWVTFDPTPPAGQPSSAKAMWTHWLLYVDAADTLWRQWIVDYNFDRQIDLAARIERRTRRITSPPDLRQLRNRLVAMAQVFWLPGLLVITVGAAAAATYVLRARLGRALTWRRYGARARNGLAAPADAAVLYTRMLNILESRGISKPPWLTPGEFAHALPDGASPALVRDLTDAYHLLRYGADADAGLQMVRLLGELETQTSRRGH